MFKKIDNKLINTAQWLVRQFELFTPYTRNILGKAFVSILSFAAIAHFFSFFFFALIEISPALGVVALPLPYLLYVNTQVFKKIIVLQEKERYALSKAVVIRFEIRKNEMTTLFLFIFPTTILAFLFSEKEIGMLAGLFFCAYCIIDNVTEYFLCTTSLPPGEKKKKLLEKESKKLTPVSVKN